MSDSIAQGVRANDPAALERLYAAVSAFRNYARKHSSEGDDVLHNTYLTIVRLMQDATKQEYNWETLPAVIRTIIQRKSWDTHRKSARLVELSEHHPVPHHRIENVTLRRGLESLKPVHREILERYLAGETPAEIMAAMGLDAHQERNTMWQAKRRLVAACTMKKKKRASSHPVSSALGVRPRAESGAC